MDHEMDIIGGTSDAGSFNGDPAHATVAEAAGEARDYS